MANMAARTLARMPEYYIQFLWRLRHYGKNRKERRHVLWSELVYRLHEGYLLILKNIVYNVLNIHNAFQLIV